MKKIIYYVLILLISSHIFSYFNGSVFAKIKKRVHPDGTVEYYSVKNKKGRARGCRRLSKKYDSLIEKYTKKNKISICLVKCLIQAESSFKSKAVSVAGAMGLMQLMQSTAEYYNVTDALDPEQNIEAGTRHLAELLTYFKGDSALALAAYHAGIGRVKRRNAIPPIKSTIAYVNKIMTCYSGKGTYNKKVKKLYKRLSKDGTLYIYSK